MAKSKSARRTPAAPRPFEQARDELFSHILRCGVLEALPEHQKEWFDDTMVYLLRTCRQSDLVPGYCFLRFGGDRSSLEYP